MNLVAALPSLFFSVSFMKSNWLTGFSYDYSTFHEKQGGKHSYHHPKMKLWEGNVFTGVCHSVQNSNNADVLLDSGLNLFDIIANLCSNLYYEVLLKSRNYIVNLSKLTLNARTWIVRFGHLVWVCKLADIVTKSLLCIYLESCFGSKDIKHLLKK